MSEETINIRNAELAKRYKKLRYETVKIVIKGDGDYSDDYWEEKLLSFLQKKDEHPVIPQKILKLDWAYLSRKIEVSEEIYIKDLKRKQDEIIDVINDMKGVTK